MGLTNGTGGATGMPKKDPLALGPSQDKVGMKKVAGTGTAPEDTVISEDYKTQAGRDN